MQAMGKRPLDEKRKGTEVLTRWVKWTGVAGWLFIFTIVMYFDKAKPESESFFQRALHTHIRTWWDVQALTPALYLMLFLLFISISTLIINMMRHKRKTDKYNPSIITLIGMSLTGILYLLHNQAMTASRSLNRLSSSF